MSDIKLIFENWNKAMFEVEEQPPQNKSVIFDDVNKEATNIVKKIRTASKNDDNLAKEAIESLIVALQISLRNL
tara:strand:+ start:3724 stop:3945 length:222 start_codon:yes stop_codon:yes gene_type:complete